MASPVRGADVHVDIVAATRPENPTSVRRPVWKTVRYGIERDAGRHASHEIQGPHVGIPLLAPIECNALLVGRQSHPAVMCRRSRNAELPAAPIDPEQLLAGRR